MNVTCQDCRSVFRVDPAKVPPNGIRARCSVCGAILRISLGATAPLTSPSISSRIPTPLRSPVVPTNAPASSPGVRRNTPGVVGAVDEGMHGNQRPTPSVSTPGIFGAAQPLSFGSAVPTLAPAAPSQSPSFGGVSGAQGAALPSVPSAPDTSAVFASDLPMAPVATPPTVPVVTPLNSQDSVARPGVGGTSSAAPTQFAAPLASSASVPGASALQVPPPASPAETDVPVWPIPVIAAPPSRGQAGASASTPASPGASSGNTPPALPSFASGSPGIPTPFTARPLVPPPPSPGQLVGTVPPIPAPTSLPAPGQLAGMAPPGPAPTSLPASTSPQTSPQTPVTEQRRVINPFLRSDPLTRAKRLARALVSDMVAYQPTKRADGLANGTLKQLFRDEIRKSYDEYVEQVGRDVAESTAFFQDALNEVLAGGQRVF